MKLFLIGLLLVSQVGCGVMSIEHTRGELPRIDIDLPGNTKCKAKAKTDSARLKCKWRF